MTGTRGRRPERDLQISLQSSQLQPCNEATVRFLLEGIRQLFEIVCTSWTTRNPIEAWEWADRVQVEHYELQIVADGSADALPLNSELRDLDDAFYHMCLVLQGDAHQPEGTITNELREALYPGILLSEMDELYRIDHWQRVWKPLLDKAIHGLDETPSVKPDKDIISLVRHGVALAERMRDEYGRAAALWMARFTNTDHDPDLAWSGRPSELPVLQRCLLENVATALDEFADHFHDRKPAGTAIVVVKNEEDAEVLSHIRTPCRQLLAWLIDASLVLPTGDEVQTRKVDSERAQMVLGLYDGFSSDLPEGYFKRQHIRLFSVDDAVAWSELCRGWRDEVAGTPPRQKAPNRGPLADGRLGDEITITEAAEKYDVYKSYLTKAAQKKPGELRYLPTRKVGRHRFVKRQDAAKFARDIEARREQRIVGSKCNESAAVAIVKQLKNESRSRPSR